MLHLPDHWVWDSWYATDDEGLHHAFFLRASRALLNPERRHRHASIGHAVSADLRDWHLVADSLVPADDPSWDDLATWTGSVVKGPEGRWYMFYTGVSRSDDGLVQRIGLATSADLITWERHGAKPLVEADPAWYERLSIEDWHEEAWRDPWVFPDPAGDGWHMLITARANHGAAEGRGVIGHARSDDLLHWEVRPALSAPAGFGHLEVPQVAVIDGQPLLMFCTDKPEPRIWAVPGPSLTGPWDISQARPVNCPDLYAPRLIRDSAGIWHLIGFISSRTHGFVGVLSDPVPVRYTTSRGLHGT
ncbi:MAG: hypothetical protein ACRDN0_13810 [Trebonia sp.]